MRPGWQAAELPLEGISIWGLTAPLTFFRFFFSQRKGQNAPILVLEAPLGQHLGNQ